MKNIIMFILCCAVLLPGCATTGVKTMNAMSVKETETVQSQYTGPKRRIAVIDFENKTKYGARRLGNSASDILVTELVKSDKFIVIEREKLNKIIEEQKLSMTDLIDQDSAVQAGKLLGVSAIVTGSISQFGVKEESVDALLVQTKNQIAQAVVDIRVIDVETGEIIYADSGKSEVKKKFSTALGLGSKGSYDETIEGEALRAAIVKFVNNIISRINQKPWFCKIVQVKEPDIYLNAGKQSGLKLKTKLKVFRQGDEIKDPDTGKVLGTDEKEVAVIEVERYFGENGSVARLVSGKLQEQTGICRITD